jgi:hypothetical protein
LFRFAIGLGGLLAGLLAAALACAATFTPGCEGRRPAPLAADGTLNAVLLLDEAARGRRFKIDDQESLAQFDSMLVTQYGLANPIALLADETAKGAFGRTAKFVMNNYVIAAQMAHGAALRANLISGEHAKLAGYFIYTATEPYPGDTEIAGIAERLAQARKLLGAMDPRLIGFSSWALRAFAFDDKLAADASLRGYCALMPSAADNKLLSEAINAVRLVGPARQPIPRPSSVRNGKS